MTLLTRESAPRCKGSLPVWIELQPLVDRCMGNLELADRLLARFKQGLDESAARFEDAVDAEDLAQLEKLAHRLRGEASNVSALRIADLATHVEELARMQSTDEAFTAAEDLIRACRQFPQEVFTLSELAASPGC